jgi:hypothetical protein
MYTTAQQAFKCLRCTRLVSCNFLRRFGVEHLWKSEAERNFEGITTPAVPEGHRDICDQFHFLFMWNWHTSLLPLPCTVLQQILSSIVVYAVTANPICSCDVNVSVGLAARAWTLCINYATMKYEILVIRSQCKSYLIALPL